MMNNKNTIPFQNIKFVFIYVTFALFYGTIIKSFATETDMNPWQNADRPSYYLIHSNTELLSYSNVKNTPISSDFPKISDTLLDWAYKYISETYNNFPSEWTYEKLPLGPYKLNYNNNPLLTEIDETIKSQAETLHLLNKEQKANFLTKQNFMLIFAFSKFFDIFTTTMQYYELFPNNSVYAQFLTLGISAAFVVAYNLYSSYTAPPSFYQHSLLVEYTAPIFWMAWEIKKKNSMSNQTFCTLCKEAIQSIDDLPDRRSSVVQFLENRKISWISYFLPKKHNYAIDFEAKLRITLCRSLYRLEDIPCKEQDSEWQAEFIKSLQPCFERIKIVNEDKKSNLSQYDKLAQQEISSAYEKTIDFMQIKYGARV